MIVPKYDKALAVMQIVASCAPDEDARAIIQSSIDQMADGGSSPDEVVKIFAGILHELAHSNWPWAVAKKEN